MDEIIDFGYPQNCLTNEVEPFIVSQPITFNKSRLPKLNFLSSATIKAEATHIPITESEKRNEIFVDVVENLHVLFNSTK